MDCTLLPAGVDGVVSGVFECAAKVGLEQDADRPGAAAAGSSQGLRRRTCSRCIRHAWHIGGVGFGKWPWKATVAPMGCLA